MTKEEAIRLSNKCNSFTEFRKRYSTAYHWLHRNDMLGEVNHSRRVKLPKITYDFAYSQALLYSSRLDFGKGSNSSYKFLIKNKMLDEACSHMVSQDKQTRIGKASFMKSGIYMLYKDDSVVYVGKSLKSVYDRVIKHSTYMSFDKAIFYDIENIADINIREIVLIEA